MVEQHLSSTHADPVSRRPYTVQPAHGFFVALAGLIDWRACAAFFLPFLLYIATLAPTLYNLDSAEFTVAAATGGLIRATGYPLYLLLSRVWVNLIPFGDFAFRLNLFSAFTGALTILLAERILRRWQIGNWATVGALGLLAVSPYFWGLSLIAEVYTMQTALMAGLLLLLLRWEEQPSTKRLMAVAFLGGLSLGHHAATALLIPAFVCFALLTAYRQILRPKAFGLIFIAGLLGFSIYLYLPLLYLTKPIFNYAGTYDAFGVFTPLDLRTPQGMFDLISARAFLGNAEPSAAAGIPFLANLQNFLRLLVQAFFAIGIGPGLLGAAVQFRQNWRRGLLFGLTLLVNALFFMNYSVVDNDTMLLPVYLVWALWVAIGYQTILDWLRAHHSVWPRYLLRATMLLAVIIACAWNWRFVDRSNDYSARIRGETIMRQVLPNALVFGAWETVPLLEYLQLIEHQRADVTPINRFLIKPENMYRYMEQELAERPVYIDSVPKDLPPYLELRPAGLLFRVWPSEAAASVEQRCPAPVNPSVVTTCIYEEPLP